MVKHVSPKPRQCDGATTRGYPACRMWPRDFPKITNAVTFEGRTVSRKSFWGENSYTDFFDVFRIQPWHYSMSCSMSSFAVKNVAWKIWHHSYVAGKSQSLKQVHRESPCCKGVNAKLLAAMLLRGPGQEIDIDYEQQTKSVIRKWHPYCEPEHRETSHNFRVETRIETPQTNPTSLCGQWLVLTTLQFPQIKTVGKK